MQADAKSLTVWFVTDNKAGHRSQLLGLEKALSIQCDLNQCRLNCHWLSIEHDWQAIKTQLKSLTLASPDWVIGAGRLTHLPVLLLKWRHRARAMVLSKPAWPFGWFDLLALPRHDKVKPRKNLLLTEGSLNPVQPATSPDPHRGLILVGGPSVHFAWDADALLAQIKVVVQREKAIHWTLSDSRRTPKEFLAQLEALKLPNLTLQSYKQTPQGWVAEQLQHCATVWVSQDSVSMVYESLSAGAQVGLLSMPVAGRGLNRVVMGVESLVERKLLTPFSVFQHQGYVTKPNRNPLQEANRVAQWMLDYDFGHKNS